MLRVYKNPRNTNIMNIDIPGTSTNGETSDEEETPRQNVVSYKRRKIEQKENKKKEQQKIENLNMADD